ncbi:META domain-containing protein [Pseudothauera rhizosphaerae]|uniref:META domain-containing protein n=1 Tax=Pseudothauera rhizosphaerae TaxID=2565932 RepID=A0A4S4AWQ1_9RHOO|nr:META domain-containing protein [Pseudothauera rhizosphaerae]THF64441.1 META domain-containing protein [Pseudothauera rhizosphaerae]
MNRFLQSISTLAATACAALLLAACAAVSASPATTLLDVEWRLIELEGQAVEAGGRRAAHLILSSDGRVAGSGGCNRLLGSYRLEGEKLSFGQLAGTRMACLQGMEQERILFDALAKVTRWRTEDGRLALFDEAGTVRARFARADEAAGNAYEGPGWSGSEVVYRCAGAAPLQVTYVNLKGGDAFAVLLHEGRQHLMQSRVAASGVRYVDVNEERGLRWYTKGGEGFLNALAADHTASERSLLGDCRAVGRGG